MAAAFAVRPALAGRLGPGRWCVGMVVLSNC